MSRGKGAGAGLVRGTILTCARLHAAGAAPSARVTAYGDATRQDGPLRFIDSHISFC